MDKVCRKLTVDFVDLHKDLVTEFSKYTSVMEYYRTTRWSNEPICRLMTPYPMASEHRASISKPQFYTPAKKGMTEETTDFIAYTIRNIWGNPNSMVFMKSKFAETTSDCVKELIRRIQEHEQNYHLEKIEMCLAWKSPKFKLKQHKDSVQDWQKSAVRYHCIIKSNPNNFLYSGDDPDNMNQYLVSAGEIWALDTAQYHKACNVSDYEDCLHFIVDFIA